MDKIEVQLIAKELYQDYGKIGSVDNCFEMINKVKTQKETVFWESVLKYIEDNFGDDDLIFGEG